MIVRRALYGLVCLSLGPVAPASAEVTRVAPDGFSVAGSLDLPVSVAEAWEALVVPSAWWSSGHSWSGDASNMSLDPRAGGCFCETLPGGGSVEHMRVIYAAPREQLRMSGALGPLQSESLSGIMTVRLAPAGEGTRLDWIYKVGGSSELPLDTIAPAVDGVVGEQFGRLAGWLARPR